MGSEIRFKYELAQRLSMTVSELEHRMSEQELRMWGILEGVRVAEAKSEAL